VYQPSKGKGDIESAQENKGITGINSLAIEILTIFASLISPLGCYKKGQHC